MYKTTLKIDGMMCGMCEAHVNDAIRNAFNIKNVESSHKRGETVVISKEKIDEDKLRTVIDETGYKLEEVHTESYEKGGLFSFLKKQDK